jgi:hypothetical protein
VDPLPRHLSPIDFRDSRYLQVDAAKPAEVARLNMKIGSTIRKWPVLLTVLSVLIMTLLVVLFSGARRHATFIYGNIAPGDASAIKRVIEHSVRVREFSKVSWTNISGLPRALRVCVYEHIQAISEQRDGTVTANVRYRLRGRYIHAEEYRLRKDLEGWHIVGVKLLVD